MPTIAQPTQGQWIDRNQDWFGARQLAGAKDGSLTLVEQESLRQSMAAMNKLEQQYRADGDLSATERKALWQDASEINRTIFDLRHNNLGEMGPGGENAHRPELRRPVPPSLPFDPPGGHQPPVPGTLPFDPPGGHQPPVPGTLPFDPPGGYQPPVPRGYPVPDPAPPGWTPPTGYPVPDPAPPGWTPPTGGPRSEPGPPGEHNTPGRVANPRF